MKLEILHIDTCLPCYFSGHHKAHVQIPVWAGISLKEIKDSLISEIAHGIVGGSDHISQLLNDYSDFSEKEKEKEQYYKKAISAINRIKPEKKHQKTFFNNLEKNEDFGDETVYAYFLIIEC